MKKLFVLLFSISLLAACNSKASQTEPTSNAEASEDTIDPGIDWEDSTQYAQVHFYANLPQGDDAANKLIRDSLLLFMYQDASRATIYDEMTPIFKPYQNTNDVKGLIASYGKQLINHYNQVVKKEFEENKQYIQKDSDKTEAEKKEALASLEIIPWSYDLNLFPYREAENYTIYALTIEAYFAGAHGSHVAYDYTFDKKTGKEFKQFFKKNAAKSMQSLLRKGLCEYFTESGEERVNDSNLLDFLCLIDEQGNDLTEIPLPQWGTIPEENGICLTYQSYEIAPYAAGMPSFIIPYDKVKPYLTPEALQLLGLDK